MTDTTATPALTSAQLAILASLGVLLWFGAALLIRSTQPLGALEGISRWLFYALLVPGTVPFVLLTRRLARLRGDQTMLGVGVVTGTAALADGLALAVVPSLYGADPAGAGAAILWGVGVGLWLALRFNRRA